MRLEKFTAFWGRENGGITRSVPVSRIYQHLRLNPDYKKKWLEYDKITLTDLLQTLEEHRFY